MIRLVRRPVDTAGTGGGLMPSLALRCLEEEVCPCFCGQCTTCQPGAYSFDLAGESAAIETGNSSGSQVGGQ